MSRNVKERTVRHVRPTKTQITLRFRALCSDIVVRMKKLCIPSFQNEPSEDPDQTARMRRLIWIFAGRTC